MRTLDDILKDGAALFVFLSDAGTAAGPAGVLLAMGSQDLRVADTAARAFQEVGADYLVCSGGFGKDTTGLLKEPESVLYARRCRELGVPADRILIEDKSTNSGENFRFSRALLAERNPFEPDSSYLKYSRCSQEAAAMGAALTQVEAFLQGL